MLIDALGYYQITEKNTPNLIEFFKNGFFQPLNTLLGYSHTIIPSIFSGTYPNQHEIWALYKMSKGTSPFKLSPLLPQTLLDKNKLVRYFFNTLIFNNSKKRGLIPPYWTTVNIPLRLLKYFDLSMKKFITEPNAMGKILTFFDLLRQKDISFEYVGYPWIEGAENILPLVKRHIQTKSVVVAYIGDIDHNGHKYGVNSQEYFKRLKSFDELLGNFLQGLMNSDKVCITIFSDHGMEDTIGTVDLERVMNSTDLKMEKDYLMFLDSTIARFWILNESAKEILVDALNHTQGGHILTEDEVQKYKLNFKSREPYGHLLYLTDVGKVILPNFYSILNGSIKAMHGWEPEHPTQQSFFFTTHKPQIDVFEDVTKIFYLLKKNLNL